MRRSSEMMANLDRQSAVIQERLLTSARAFNRSIVSCLELSTFMGRPSPVVLEA